MFKKEQYLKNNFVKKYLPEMEKLCAKFSKKNHAPEIKFLSYIKQYDQGQVSELCTQLNWLEYKLQHYNKAEAIMPRVGVGITQWNKSNHAIIKNMREEAAKFFNINAVIEFSYRDNVQSCFHLYSFYTTLTFKTKIEYFYAKHKTELLRIIADLENKGCQFFDATIRRANYEAPEDFMFHVPNYKITRHMNHPNEFNAMLSEQLFYKLTSHEMEIIILYGAGGFTTKQISYLINKSQKTVEYHVSQIKNKTNLTDRKDMNAYVRAKGWDKLVNFYTDFGNNNTS